MRRYYFSGVRAHNGKRHKCHICGAVRYEYRMEPIPASQVPRLSQWGNDEKLWKCKNDRHWREENDTRI